MVCPECNADVQPVNHNGRGPRCPMCWARVVVEPIPPTEQKAETAAPPKRRGKSA